MPASRPGAFAAELDAALRECPAAQRKFVFVGVLNRHRPRLPRSARAVLVGGAAVELYTAGAYVTGDVDLVADREWVLELLVEAGFERSGRLYLREDLELAVDVVGWSLRRGETVVELEVRRYRVPVVTVEDTIVDRLLAAEYWKSRTDWEQAVLLYEAHREDLDPDALAAKARANDVSRALDNLIAEVSGRRGPNPPSRP